MAITFTPDALQRIAYSTYNGVYNRKQPYIIDRKQMPFLSFLSKHEDTAPLAGSGGPIVKLKIYGGLDLQGWQRLDTLQFAEQDFELQTQYPWSNIHMGAEFVHDDIEAMGFVVLPNQPRGKNFAKADSESDAYRLVDWLSHAIEDMLDSFDVKEDQLLLSSNSSNSKLPQGLDAYWPISSSASDYANYTSDGDGLRGYYQTGSVGGQTRASYPDLQHFCWYNATYAASGSLRRALITARREAELRSRGRSKGGIRFMMAGAGFIDRYVAFATKNGTNYTTSFINLDPKGNSRLDIGIPDTGLHFEGIPIVHNPSFEILDSIYGPTVTWTNRCYEIDTDSMRLAYAPGKKKFFSAPMDEGDTRVTRLSLDSKMVLLPLINNANSVVSVTA